MNRISTVGRLLLAVACVVSFAAAAPGSTRRLAGAASLVLAGLLAVPAAADEVVASGERGRTYHDFYAVNLIGQLPGFRVSNRPTKGSGENLELLADGEADVGFAQADIFAMRLRKNPKRYGRLTVVGRLADECIFIATRVGGPIASFASLGGSVEGRKPRISTALPVDTVPCSILPVTTVPRPSIMKTFSIGIKNGRST